MYGFKAMESKMIADTATNIDSVRKLQRSLYQSVKDDPRCAFHSLYDKVYRTDILKEAFRRAKRNGGAPGIDNQSWEEVDQDKLIQDIQEKLKNKKYRFSTIKRVYIPKPDGSRRGLGIPTIGDRIVETAMQMVIEPIFEAKFYQHSYGFRPRKNAHQMVDKAAKLINAGYSICLDIDVEKFFDRVNHKILLKSLSFRIKDGSLLRLIKGVLEAPVSEANSLSRSKIGCPQGSPTTPRTQLTQFHTTL